MSGRLRWRPGALVLAAVALLACATVVRALQAVGERGRIHRPGLRLCDPGLAVRTVSTAREGYAAIAREGGSGRVVVSVSRYLHFQAVDDDEVWRGARSFPLALGDLGRFYEARVDVTTALWVAMRTGKAREIVHVVPPSTWAEKRAAAVADPTDVLSIDEARIVLHHWGSRRIVTALVPSPDEPVVLEVDASYFEQGDAARLARDLRDAGLGADLLVLDSAEDNPAVTSLGRAGLESFARSMCAEGARVR